MVDMEVFSFACVRFLRPDLSRLLLGVQQAIIPKPKPAFIQEKLLWLQRLLCRRNDLNNKVLKSLFWPFRQHGTVSNNIMVPIILIDLWPRLVQHSQQEPVVALPTTRYCISTFGNSPTRWYSHGPLQCHGRSQLLVQYRSHLLYLF
jgi:hypothetical protein